MTSRRVFAIRHGQTDWNAAGRFQGQTDVPLNEEGRRQVRAAALELAGFQPTGMISSDLSRAVDTAQAIAEAAGITFTTDERLREISVGAWEGLTRDEIAERFPEEWAQWNEGIDIPRGGGERVRECRERVGNAIMELTANPALGERIVIVGHGMALASALRWLAEEGRVRYDHPEGPMHNAQWFDVEIV